MFFETAEKDFADIFPDAILAIDPSGQLLWCNRIAEKIFSLNREALTDIHIQALIKVPNIKDFISDGFSSISESYVTSHCEKIISVKVIDRSLHCFILLLRDITHLHYLEKMREDFVANVSHELRTPLTVIHGYLEILLGEKAFSTNHLSKIYFQMYQQTLRMEKLVEDLLLLSRLESEAIAHDNKKVSVSSLIKQICEDATILSGERKHRFVIRINENLQLLGNENELHAAFSNLIFNAVHYTPASGKIEIMWEENNGVGTLQVSDTGIGICQEDIPRVTERFYRADKARSRESGGTGLGLAIVKHVLIRHEGRLEIESKMGKGSTFLCLFPKKRLFHPEKTYILSNVVP